jgi:cytochrome P450
MVLLEAMRLYPPAWGIERRALCEQEIGGCVIPAGAVVLMPTFLMNRDERFFPDPLRFDPERFAPEAVAGRPRHAFLLFGGGPRQCIGNAFALLEGVLIVSVLAQRWRLQLAPGHAVTAQATVTLRPRGGLPMTVERRAA